MIDESIRLEFESVATFNKDRSDIHLWRHITEVAGRWDKYCWIDGRWGTNPRVVTKRDSVDLAVNLKLFLSGDLAWKWNL